MLIYKKMMVYLNCAHTTLREVHQMEIDRSLLPMAQQTYCFGLDAASLLSVVSSSDTNKFGWKRTHVTALRWPTKSILAFQPFRSMIFATGPPVDKRGGIIYEIRFQIDKLQKVHILPWPKVIVIRIGGLNIVYNIFFL